MLQVDRVQLPLAPAFAITAHAAQGRTLPAAIIDLQLGRGVSIIASYIAFTRVRRRGDLLIFREFERSLFAQGSPRGPALLLRVLRGDVIDWAALEAEFAPQRTCTGCGQSRFKDEYGALQWKKPSPWCTACVQEKKDANALYQCSGCDAWKAKDALSSGEVARGQQKLCTDCAEEAAEEADAVPAKIEITWSKQCRLALMGGNDQVL